MKWTITRSIAVFVAALLLSITCLTISSLALTATQTDTPMITASIQRNTAVKISFLFIKKDHLSFFRKVLFFGVCSLVFR